MSSPPTADGQASGSVRAVSRVPVALVALAAVALAAVMALVVPAGQPYDEPSHWGTVVVYADTGRLPELGEPGTSYQAQMGPVFYSVAAGVLRAVGGDGAVGDETGFYAVRLLSSALVAAVVVLTHRLARTLVPGRPGVALGAAAFMGVTPTVVAFSGSVQNDTAALLLALAAAAVAAPRLAALGGVDRRTGDDGAGWWGWVAVGVLVGLAVLAKVQTLALLPALAAGALAVPAAGRRRALVRVAGAAVVAGVVSGWWFVRNLVLYGDLTGRSGVARTGAVFEPIPLDGPGDLVEWARSVVSVVWVPTEYHRNLYEAPAVLRLAALGATAAVVALVAVALVRRRRDRRPSEQAAPGPWWPLRPEVAFVAAWSVVTFVAYVLIAFGWSSIGPRAFYVAAPPVVIGVAALVDRHLPSRVATGVAVGAVAFAVGVDLWLAVQASRIAEQPYWIVLGP